LGVDQVDRGLKHLRDVVTEAGNRHAVREAVRKIAKRHDLCFSCGGVICCQDPLLDAGREVVVGDDDCLRSCLLWQIHQQTGAGLGGLRMVGRDREAPLRAGHDPLASVFGLLVQPLIQKILLGCEHRDFSGVLLQKIIHRQIHEAATRNRRATEAAGE